MSPAPHRDDSRPEKESHAAEQPAEPAVGSHMLDQILELTAGGLPQAGFVEPDDIVALRAVAKTLAGQPFALDPVVVELIQAVLGAQFRKAGIPTATVRAIARQIAATLYDDPRARERLQVLWNGLVQES